VERVGSLQFHGRSGPLLLGACRTWFHGLRADVSGSRTVTLRRARREDAREIAELWHRGWRDGHLGLVPQGLVEARTEESFRKRASERVHEATVVVVDGAIAGFVIVVGDEVEQVYVSAAYRGTGVADVLLREAERQVCANGHSTAWLGVVPGNARARAFYERAGWRDEGPFEYAASAETGAIAVWCHRYTKQVGAPDA
jgi:ribosomal protein S18 acetylase RimI-like enzyme